MTSNLLHAARGATVAVCLMIAMVGCENEARISYETPPDNIDRPGKAVAPTGDRGEETGSVVSYEAVG